jgi:outer membrane protein assembly factor BamD (BamD/ComL family)
VRPEVHAADAKARTLTTDAADAPTRTADAKASASPLELESGLVLAARDAVRSGDCGSALETLRQAHERFPFGPLGQERDALQVEALACSGRAADAATAADAFVRAYPDSPHAAAARRFLPR